MAASSPGRLTLTVLLLPLIASACDPLIFREGVHVKCIAPKGPTFSRPTPVDCYDKARQIPPGTVARYGCDEPYYTQQNPENDRERTMTCSLEGGTGGAWVGGGGLARFYSHACTLNCGVLNLGALTTFIIDGSLTKQADWPWHAIILKRNRSNSTTDFQYICGGSLIKPTGSREFLIVTAAHCLETGGRGGIPRHFDDVRVVLGSDKPRLPADIDTRSESPDPAQMYEVKEILLHESYDGWRSVFQSDIALIRLQGRVRLASNVLPVCLSKSVGRPKLEDTGHIAGFGLFRLGAIAHSLTLRRASLPVVHPDNCNAWRPTRKLSVQEYCAGTEAGQNACNGDSGGGMVFNASDAGGHTRFYLHGIVSHGRAVLDDRPASTACDTYTVFTKVASYLDWIYEIVEELSEPSPGSEGRPSAAKTTTTVAPPAAPTLDWAQWIATSTTKPAPASAPVQTTPQNKGTTWATPPPPPPRTHAPTPSNCGRINSNAPFSQNVGVISSRADWPWQAIILTPSGPGGEDFVYSCSGTLVPAGRGLAVLTAASCVTHEDTVMKVGQIRVGLGLLEQLLEGMDKHSPNAQVYEVRRISIHPSYNSASPRNDHDIALIQLVTSSNGANSIPACLPPSSAAGGSPHPQADDMGHVVSFRAGLFEDPGASALSVTGVASRLTRTSFPVTNARKCAKGLVTSPTLKFCAGNSSILANACHARRGGGFIVGRVEDGGGGTRFHVEGVVSRGGNASGWSAALACRFGAFTRVAAYVEWIQETVAQFAA